MSKRNTLMSKNVIQLSCDYLVIGTGAMGMAFVDTLLNESQSSNVIMVDRYAYPGGHWTVSYPFVTLHQPSACYGVASRILGHPKFVPDNLASGVEIQSYYKKVMETFLATKRVRFLMKCDHLGSGQIVSIVDSNRKYIVKFKKIVDATFMKVEVPSMRPPTYRVDDGVLVKPPNELVNISQPYDGYVVVGAGKTGIDACLWLLNNQVHPNKITWIMPNDSWMINRGQFKPDTFLNEFMLQHIRCILEGNTIDEVFDRFEATNVMIRLDKGIIPTRYRCATVSEDELHQLQTLKNIVRKGRVLHITQNEIALENGTIPTNSKILHIDCTANGLAKIKPVPIFQDKKIVLQSVRVCQQVYSAAIIAAVEVHVEESDLKKNRFCLPVPHPYTPGDLLTTTYYQFLNMLSCGGHRKMNYFERNCRLNWAYHFPVFPTIAFGLWNIRSLRSLIKRFLADMQSERLVKLPLSSNPHFVEIISSSETRKNITSLL